MHLSNKRKESFQKEIQIYALWDNYGSLPAYEAALCYSGNKDLVSGDSAYWKNFNRRLLDLGDTYFDRNEYGGFSIGKLRGILRKRGVNISTILGNHDAYLVAFILGIPMPHLREERLSPYQLMVSGPVPGIRRQIDTDFLWILWEYDVNNKYHFKMFGFLELARFIKTPFVSKSNDSYQKDLLRHILLYREEILPNMRIQAPEVLEELKHFKLFDSVGEYCFWHTDPSKEVMSFLLENKWDIHKINNVFQENLWWLIDNASFPVLEWKKQQECMMNVWNIWKDVLHVNNRIPEFYYQPSRVPEYEEWLLRAKNWELDDSFKPDNPVIYYERNLELIKLEEEEKQSVIEQMRQFQEMTGYKTYVHAHSTTSGKPKVRKLWSMYVINVDTGYGRVWNIDPYVDPAVIHLRTKVPLRVQDLLSVAKRKQCPSHEN